MTSSNASEPDEARVQNGSKKRVGRRLPAGLGQFDLFSLNTRLVLVFLLVALIPTVVTGALSYWQSQAALRSRIVDSMSRISKDESDAVKRWFDQAQQDVITLAGTARVRTMDKAQMVDAVKQYYDQWGIFDDLTVYGLDGASL
jgi:hypothetical protein